MEEQDDWREDHWTPHGRKAEGRCPACQEHADSKGEEEKAAGDIGDNANCSDKDQEPHSQGRRVLMEHLRKEDGSRSEDKGAEWSEVRHHQAWTGVEGSRIKQKWTGEIQSIFNLASDNHQVL